MSAISIILYHISDFIIPENNSLHFAFVKYQKNIIHIVQIVMVC